MLLRFNLLLLLPKGLIALSCIAPSLFAKARARAEGEGEGEGGNRDEDEGKSLPPSRIIISSSSSLSSSPSLSRRIFCSRSFAPLFVEDRGAQLYGFT